MTEKKLTKVEMLREAAKILREQEADKLAEMLEKEANTVEKRNEKNRNKKSKAAQENEGYAIEVTNVFKGAAEEGVAYTLAEIGEMAGLADLTPQKMSAVMAYVENAEKVEKATSNKTKVGYKRIEV